MEHAEPTRKGPDQRIRPAPSAPRATRHTPTAEVVLQAKLEVGPVGDAFEREADHVADQVVRTLRGSIAHPVISPTPGRIRRSAVTPVDGSGPAGGGLDRDTEQRIQSSRGGGAPLPVPDRAVMESAFGADFGGIRVHHGAGAAELNQRIQAKAFTVGSDIYFRDGLPDTSSTAGQHLLAHELTHTIQQTGRVSRRVRRAPQRRRRDRIQRTGIRVVGRATTPVVQRAGEAQKALDAIELLITRAKALRDQAEQPGMTLEQLEPVKVEVASIVAEVDGHIAAAQKDPNAKNYGGAFKTKRAQVVAQQDRVNGPLVAAVSAASSIAESVGAFQGAVAAKVDDAQAKVGEALTAMADTKTMKVTAAEAAAGRARAAASSLVRARKTFRADATKTLATIDAWAKMTTSDHQQADRARVARKQLIECARLTESILGLLQSDANEAASRAEQLAAAVRRYAAAAKDDKATRLAHEQQAAALAAADDTLAKAEEHARQCADEYAEAQKLADEARQSAEEAQHAADEAAAAAGAAESRATSLARGLAFSAKHLGQWPSAAGSALHEQRRAEADLAEQTAREKRAHSSGLAQSAAESDRASQQRAATAAHARGDHESASKARDAAKGERESAHSAKHQADLDRERAVLELGDAQAAGDAAKQDVGAHGRKLTALAAAIPDATLRAKLRIHYGDEDLQALLACNVSPQVLDTAAQAISAMIKRWGASSAGNIVARVQELDSTALLASYVATLPAEATHERALALLDCPGDGFAWFIDNGLRTADALLTRSWSTGHVQRLLRAAELEAKLSGTQLVTFEQFMDRVALTVDPAEKLLQAGTAATFLVGHALSSVETLLTREPAWSIEQVVQLVKAAGKRSKPTKTQFEAFCQLVADHAVPIDRAVRIMKGAKCTGGYLVDAAFLPLRDADVAGWSTDACRKFVDAAETEAKLDKQQLARFSTLVHANTFTAAHVDACLRSTGVASWTTLMDRVDDFVADGNKGVPVAIGGVAPRSKLFGPANDQARLHLQVARVQHFVDGHTFRHYDLSSANIYRSGNLPSSMWPRGTRAADVAAKALNAIKTAQVKASATRARTGQGSGDAGDFDQADYGTYVAGVQWFAGPPGEAVLMQFFPTAGAVPADTLAAIGRLFNGAI